MTQEDFELLERAARFIGEETYSTNGSMLYQQLSNLLVRLRQQHTVTRVYPLQGATGVMRFSTANSPNTWSVVDAVKASVSKPLDEKEINECYRKADTWLDFGRRIEAKHNIGEST